MEFEVREGLDFEVDGHMYKQLSAINPTNERYVSFDYTSGAARCTGKTLEVFMK